MYLQFIQYPERVEIRFTVLRHCMYKGVGSFDMTMVRKKSTVYDQQIRSNVGVDEGM